MSEWQPIETAPKGGGAADTRDPAWVDPTRIVGWSKSLGLVVMYWDWYYAEGGNGYEPGRTAWVVGDEGALYENEAPTHWMLPDPPHPSDQQDDIPER